MLFAGDSEINIVRIRQNVSDEIHNRIPHIIKVMRAAFICFHPAMHTYRFRYGREISRLQLLVVHIHLLPVKGGQWVVRGTLLFTYIIHLVNN